MGGPDRTAGEALRLARDALTALGLDGLAGEAARLVDFADGPTVVTVAGLPYTGRGPAAAAVTRALPDAVVVPVDLRELPAYPVWDALVVTTPADRALGRAEEATVLRARRWGCPVALVVTHAAAPDDPAEQAATEAEIERYRLLPALGGRGVRWWFAAEPAAAHLAGVLDEAPAALHERAARAALRLLLREAMAGLADRLAARERDQARLADVQAQLPLVGTHLTEQVKLVRLEVEDLVRQHHQALYDTAGETSRAVLAWLGRSGHGDWADVEQPLRTGWRIFGDRLDAVLDTVRESFHTEARRLEGKIARAESELGLTAGPPTALAEPWRSADLDEARAALDDVSLEPLFAATSDAAHRAAERRREDERRETKVERNRVRAAANRIGDLARQGATGAIEDRIPMRIHDDLDTALSARLRVFLNVAGTTAEAGARRDADDLRAVLRQRVDRLHEAVGERHVWRDAYAELVTLAAWSGKD